MLIIILVFNEALSPFLFSEPFMSGLAQDKVLSVNIEKKGARNEEDGANDEVEATEGSLDFGNVANTSEAEGSKRILGGVFAGSAA